MKKSRIGAIFGSVFLIALLVFSLVDVQATADSAKIARSVLVDLKGSNKIVVDVYMKGVLPYTEFQKVLKTVSSANIQKTYYPEGFIANLNSAEINALARNSNVEFIGPHIVLKTTLYDSVNIVDAVGAWDMEVSGEQMTGARQTVCVVDTGVDFTHPDLEDKNILGCNLDCTDGSTCPLDCSATDTVGHGTHVAGIVAASGGIFGIGKGANLISTKVFLDGNPNTDTFLLMRAVNWCKNNAATYNISVISMSVASDALYSDYCDSESSQLAQAINSAVANNIAVVVSSGNDGSTTGITLPACMSNAIPVAATDKSDNVASFSNYNWMVKLFAPGVNITSTRIMDRGGGYGQSSGTSMSAPMVSGAIAILNQEFAAAGKAKSQHPKTDIEQALFDSGEDINGLSRNSWTRIHVLNALYELDIVNPEVSLISPNDNTFINSKRPVNVNFVCDADDWQLAQLTLSVRDSRGREAYRETRQVSGESARETFNVFGLGLGEYTWNCEATDVKGNVGKAPQDYDLRIGAGSSTGRFVRWP